MIRLYEVRDRWIIRDEEAGTVKRFVLKVVNVFWATALTAFFIGVAIMPFFVYNFNTVQIYSVLGNICAIPIFSFVVMPAILFAFLTMPFGGCGIFLRLAEVGVKAINYCAERVAGLPYASVDVKTMSVLALLLVVFGMIWLFLWDRKWKVFGCGFILLGGIFYFMERTPDVLVNKYGTVFGVNEKSKDTLGFVMMGRQDSPSKMLLDDWLLHIGGTRWNVSGKKDFSIGNRKLGIVSRYGEYKQSCLKNDIVFVTFDKSKAYYHCAKPVFDRKFWNKARGAEFYISGGKVKYKTVADYVGNRPWAYDYKLGKNENFDNFLEKIK